MTMVAGTDKLSRKKGKDLGRTLNSRAVRSDFGTTLQERGHRMPLPQAGIPPIDPRLPIA